MASVDMKPYAEQAAAALHWNPDVILAQWKLETGNFSSHVFQANNNLAGIKYVSPERNPGSDGAGSAANDGGRYAHYPSLTAGVQGYVNFVKANPRYSNVSSTQDPRGEAELLHQDGWATDPDYANEIMSVIGKGGSTATVTNTSAESGSASTGSGGSSSPTANGFPSGSDIIGIIDQSLTLKGFDVTHPAQSITQDAGAIALRAVIVIVGLVLFIFGLVAVVGKETGGMVPVPV